MLTIYIGWDPKNVLAYEVCVNSIIAHSTSDIRFIPLHEQNLRFNKHYWRSYIVSENGQMSDRNDKSAFSTQFSFTRFLVPLLEEYKDEWVLYMDSDMLVRSDITELFSFGNSSSAVMCVKHNHIPFEDIKMYGLKQTYYQRKNWSSLMLMNPSRCTGLTPYAVNNWSGESLHSMQWVPTELIGELPLEWNYLVGNTDPKKCINPKNVHYTLGTPDMPDVKLIEYFDEWLEYAKEVDVKGIGPHVFRI